MLVSLAGELGIEHGPVIADRRFVREELGAILLSLLDRSGTELQAAAAAAWQHIFGAELACPVLRARRGR